MLTKIFQKGFIELGDKNFANPFSMLGVAPQLLKLNFFMACILNGF